MRKLFEGLCFNWLENLIKKINIFGKQIQYTDMNLNEQLPKQGEINMLLSSYNDIFSHFDPSPYTKRILSDDFIMTVKNISKNKTGMNVILSLNLPMNIRNEQEEKRLPQDCTITLETFTNSCVLKYGRKTIRDY